MSEDSLTVVLRIDDVGPWDPPLERLLATLLPVGFPLSLQIVPGWLDRRTVEELTRILDAVPALLELGQHGWMHTNHAPARERHYEFGPGRTRAEQQQAIREGRVCLGKHFPSHPAGVFTPPHDRLNQDTLEALAEEGYGIVSGGPRTFAGCRVPDSLVTFPCLVDASVRVEDRRQIRGCDRIVADILAQSASPVGVVLHPGEIPHPAALAELAASLESLRQTGVRFETMSRALATTGRTSSDVQRSASGMRRVRDCPSARR